MTDAQGLITVWLNVPPEREEEFNEWYNLEHLRQVVALPGFVRARRYSVEDADLKYLAWYETAAISRASSRIRRRGRSGCAACTGISVSA
jgi:hypothetical protein